MGAVTGRAHQRSGRGSQDAWQVRRGDGFVVAVVCDGCSAGESSEVGAGLGARFVAAEVARRLQRPASVRLEDPGERSAFATDVVRALVAWLGMVVEGCTVDPAEARVVVGSCLLFTVQVAVIVDDGGFVVFGVGDGVVRVDGQDVVVHGNDDGAPDCPAYALLDGFGDHAGVVVHKDGLSADLRCVTIASDGAAELAARAAVALPNGEVFGGLAFFEDSVDVGHNPSLATKRMRALDKGAPDDDCTVVVLRRNARTARGAPCA